MGLESRAGLATLQYAPRRGWGDSYLCHHVRLAPYLQVATGDLTAVLGVLAWNQTPWKWDCQPRGHTLEMNGMTLQDGWGTASQQLQPKVRAGVCFLLIYPNVGDKHACVRGVFKLGCDPLGGPQVIEPGGGGG